GGDTYLWSTTETTASITVDESDTYTVTVTDAKGCTASATVTITVNPLPAGSISANASLVCAGDENVTLTFTATAGTGPFDLVINGETYPGILDGGTIVLTANTNTTYTLTSITDANGCTATGNSITVEVNEQPTVELPDLTEYCVGVTLTHGATVTPAAPANGAYSYTWGACASNNCTTCNTIGFVPNNTVPSPTRQWNTVSPNRSVTLTLSTPGCPDVTVCDAFSIVADPVAPVIAALPPELTVCADITLTVTVTTPGSGGTGTCVDEYRYSTDGGMTWSDWDVDLPDFVAVAGANLVESRRNCDGAGCESNVNQVSWTVGDFIPPVISACPVTRNIDGCDVSVITGPAYSDEEAVSSYEEFSDATNQGVATDNCGITSVSYEDAATGTCPIVVTRTWTVSDGINSTTCAQTININAPALAVTCPSNAMETACQTQDAIDAAFADWIGAFSTSGGCNPVSTDLGAFTAPDACGGTVSITYTATDDCGQSSACMATFTVNAPTDVTITCPENVIEMPCQTQDEIDDAFNAWLNTVVSSGGCDLDNSVGDYAIPSACGGAATVTFTATDLTCGGVSSCMATFTVTDAPLLEVICPDDVTEDPCQTQAAIDLAFNDWIAGFSTSGGCDPESTDLEPFAAPDACGGSVTITYTATDGCGQSTACTATFTVTDAPEVSLTPPMDLTVAACQTQTEVDMAFAAWLTGVTTSGGCNPDLSDDNEGAPAACGGSTTVTWTVTSDCENDVTASATFTVSACVPSGTIALDVPGIKCEGTAFDLVFTSSGGTGPFTIVVNGNTY
ncbi:MAG: hypothetical protein L6Q97_25070, partial [Thermoanaerobaculia bacterium]|nr:hypothetical protein [Thermoanaerobaculia bacterium]